MSHNENDNFPVGLRVVVVDDDPTWLRILEKMLKQCQYHVTTTNQAMFALKMLRENKERFDLVISDDHMPDMDGYKLLELVGLEMDLPFIMLSSEPMIPRKAIDNGACDYLVKPVRMKELRNIWQHVLRRKRIESKSQISISCDEIFDIIESQGNQPTSFSFGQPNMLPVKFQDVQYGEKEHQQSNDQQMNFVPADGIDSAVPVDGMNYVAQGNQCSAAAADSEKDKTSGKIDLQKRKNSTLRISLEDLEPHFGKRLADVAIELGVGRSTIKRACRFYSINRWPSKEEHKKTPSLFKAKTANEHDRDTRPSTSSSHLRLLQTHTLLPQTNTKSTQTHTLLPETDVMIIKAKYEDDIVKFESSLSLGMDKLAEEVATRLNLEMGSFKLKYVDEDNDEILLTSDIDLKLCVRSLTATGNNCIKVIVQLIHSK